MRLFYDLFLQFYYWGIRIGALLKPKANKWIKGRSNTFDQLLSFKKNNPQNIWVHCASVGEFEQGLPLINKLKTAYPNYSILVSFFSPSGYEYARQKFSELNIIYMPLDGKKNAQKWLEILDPKLAIFVKYEFWHYYFFELKERSIPLFIVSAVFWKELFFFKWYGSFFRKALQQVTHFFVQNEESKTLLSQIGIDQVTVNGDTRFERTIETKSVHFTNKKLEKYVTNNSIFITGSAWNSDIDVIKKIIAALPQKWKIIIAPHEPDNFDYDQFNQLGFKKYSSDESDKERILFLDTIGLLSRTYRFANLVYLGGGFGKGIHNILEPAVYNVPILSGPNIHRFQEAKKLRTIGILKILEKKNISAADITSHIDLDQQTLRINEEYFAENTNVSDQIIVFIKKRRFLD